MIGHSIHSSHEKEIHVLQETPLICNIFHKSDNDASFLLQDVEQNLQSIYLINLTIKNGEQVNLHNTDFV